MLIGQLVAPTRYRVTSKRLTPLPESSHQDEYVLLTDEETKSQRELCGVRLCSNQSDAGAGVGAGCQKDPWLDTRPALVSPDWHQRHHGAMTMPPLIPQVLLVYWIRKSGAP